jgi:hypothetical protein
MDMSNNTKPLTEDETGIYVIENSALKNVHRE